MARDVDARDEPEVRGGPRDYEDTIRQIREVMAVRVVAGSRGDIDEIHVLAGNGRGPKQIVRDIESSLIAQFGLSIDHKKISVAQVEEGAPTSWGSGRLCLLGVRYTTDSARAEAEVKVEFDDVIHSGKAYGPATGANRLRVAADACLSAMAEYFNSSHQLSVDDITIVELRGRRIVLTVMSLLTPDGEETLVGSSLVRRVEAEAVARSVLDAMNRRFTMIIRKLGSRNGSNGQTSGNSLESLDPFASQVRTGIRPSRKREFDSTQALERSLKRSGQSQTR